MPVRFWDTVVIGYSAGHLTRRARVRTYLETGSHHHRLWRAIYSQYNTP